MKASAVTYARKAIRNNRPLGLVIAISAIAFLIGTAVVSGCAGSRKSTAILNPEDQKLNSVIQKYSESVKRLDAFAAPYFNVEEDLGKFGDYLSPEFRERQKRIVESAMTDLQTVDSAKLSAPQATAYALFRSDIERSVRDLKFRLDYFSFDQMGNRFRSYIDDSSPELSSFPFDTAAHYKAFVRRSEGFGPFVDRQIAILREGAKAGYALNCEIAKNAIETYKDALEPVLEKNPFYRPALKMPETIA